MSLRRDLNQSQFSANHGADSDRSLLHFR